MMRVPVYLACAAALACCARADDSAAASAPFLPAVGAGAGGRFLEPVAVQADRETVDYLLPRLAAKYRPAADWSGVTDPRFYLLTEMEDDDAPAADVEVPLIARGELRRKRQGIVGGGVGAASSSRLVGGEAGGSLSIVNSLDVLRNRLLLEIARKKAKEGANRNRQFLLNLGKRAYAPRRYAGDA